MLFCHSIAGLFHGALLADILSPVVLEKLPSPKRHFFGVKDGHHSFIRAQCLMLNHWALASRLCSHPHSRT